MVKQALVILIRLYQYISGFTSKKCRFYPTCSHYAIEAIEKYGVIMGVSKAARRVSKCHPWHLGGYDPA